MSANFKTRQLSVSETISVLNRLSFQDLLEISEVLEIPIKQVRAMRIEYNAISEEKIEEAIRKLKKTTGSAQRDYSKQEDCPHHDFSAFLKCKDCGKNLSENELDQIIEMCQRKKESLKVGVRVFNLSGNKIVN